MTANETHSDETRQRIIRAALQLFGEVGYSLATTRAIADAAGVNEVTVFRHFGSKKNLLSACVEAFNQASFTGTFETELTGDYPEDIARMAQMQTQSTREGMRVIRLLFCDSRNLPELREVMLAGGRGNLARLSAYFQRQMDAGVVRPDLNAEALAMAFDSLFSSQLIFESLFAASLSPQLPASDIVDPLVKLFVRGTQNTSI